MCFIVNNSLCTGYDKKQILKIIFETNTENIY